jgi:3'-phosphoadenosine 5'-phosphosulfate sulfotransferase (PAPS reductase)/FAD synthetase
MKEEPMINYAKSIGKTIAIIGTMREEGGRRSKLNCMVMKGSKLLRFQPLAPITKEWEDWFIDAYNIDISDIYKPPYNFHRTGCKGCPFALNLQEELDTLEKFFPAERKQCELIWAPVYAEYRRLGYRLKQDERQKKGHQITIEEFLKEQNSK